jgi:hypothetical protein
MPGGEWTNNEEELEVGGIAKLRNTKTPASH